jgi:hypothetical protein
MFLGDNVILGVTVGPGVGVGVGVGVGFGRVVSVMTLELALIPEAL